MRRVRSLADVFTETRYEGIERYGCVVKSFPPVKQMGTGYMGSRRKVKEAPEEEVRFDPRNERVNTVMIRTQMSHRLECDVWTDRSQKSEQQMNREYGFSYICMYIYRERDIDPGGER